jgi:hypothetical protein
VKYNSDEFDDGVDCTGQEDCHEDPDEITKAHIDKFINSNSVNNADVVVWYGT